MGVSRLTTLEIFTNPYDLHIVIGQEKDGDKYSIAFLRGPGHNFKAMLTSAPFATTLEDAIEAIKSTLESIQQAAAKDFGDKGSLVSQVLNPDNLKVDQSKVLNADLIARITDELRQHKVASTYKMAGAPS